MSNTSNIPIEELRNLNGFGPLSSVINNNSEYTRKNIITREEAKQRFLHKSSNNDVKIEGDFRTDGNMIIKGDLFILGNVTATELTATSDERVKCDLIPVSNALDKVLQLNGYSFARKDWEKIGEAKDRRYIGVIAQEVQQVFPELVKYDDKTDLLSVNYASMAAILLESIKDLHKLQMQHLQLRQNSNRKDDYTNDRHLY